MKYYITTPIYYVNDLPHIGHAYTTVACDILARWHRIRGDEVYFLTGTDEHGAKIAQAAEKLKLTPQQLCDKNSLEFKNSWRNLNITNDSFVRTTDGKHVKAVQLFLQKLYDAGHIYKKQYKGLYCIHCEKYLSSGDLDENMCCPDHKQKPVEQSEENYFFKLSEFNDKLSKILSNESDPGHIAVFPIGRRSEVLGKLKLGLEDISISRAKLAWGIPLPFDTSQTAYVWIDALLNYITDIGYGSNEGMFNKFWPADLHLMAKDILWFHSVIWPAMLLAAGLKLPKKIFAHGFFTINGEKMSKTLGNVISPQQLIDRFGVEASKYLLVSLFPFGSDGDISMQALTDRYNTDLANNLGNLVSRTLTMVEKYFDGKIPNVKVGRRAVTLEVETKLKNINKHLDNLEFHLATGALQEAIDKANQTIQSGAPWKMAKEKDPALPEFMYNLIQSIGMISIYLVPIMPDTAQRIWEAIGNTDSVVSNASHYINNEVDINFPKPNDKIKNPGILFPRIDNKK